MAANAEHSGDLGMATKEPWKGRPAAIGRVLLRLVKTEPRTLFLPVATSVGLVFQADGCAFEVAYLATETSFHLCLQPPEQTQQGHHRTQTQSHSYTFQTMHLHLFAEGILTPGSHIPDNTKYHCSPCAE